MEPEKDSIAKGGVPNKPKMKVYHASSKPMPGRQRKVLSDRIYAQKKKDLLKNKEENEDPYPGDAPIPAHRMKKHSRGKAMNLYKGIKTPFKRTQALQKEKLVKLANKQAARVEILLPEESGFVEAEKDEFTSQFRQTDIKSSVDITSATKQFDLNLNFGAYGINYSRNGRNMVIGGRRGHIASFDWVTKDLTCEMNAMESVYDVTWLHNETMFAAAQKDYTYIYDNQGIELHCIKRMDNVLKMEFLPYHFILASGNGKGYLSWLDVSIGKLVKQTQTHLGKLDIMCQNPSNAVLCCGHSKGIVTMWTPNIKDPVAKMLCHKQPLRSCAVDPTGMYLATTAVDASLKIWDLRTYKCVQSYRVGTGVSHAAFSQKGLLAVSLGNVVEVYKDCVTEAIRYPYLKHQVGSTITGLQFCPYEDVLGVGHLNGMCSLLIPGAGEPNFDAFESNPFQTKSQRRETEVKSLLEKIQPELITLDPSELGDVDAPTLTEKLTEKQKLLFVKPQKVDVKPRRNANSAKQFHIKRRINEEERRRHIGTVGEAQKNMFNKPAVVRKSKTPAKVLDRFNPEAKKKKLK